jgi:GNAT superfamily N-acetyltransferase
MNKVVALPRVPRGRDRQRTTTARELAILLPPAAHPACPPERACEVMERELSALAHDIEAARRRAPRAWRPGLDLHRDRRVPAVAGERIQLVTGHSVVIRPIGPADARELVRTFERLGAVSRFHRFLAPVERLSDRQVRYLTRVDHVSHEALIAIDDATGEGIGVARYLRAAGADRAARFAVVVTDGWHGRGVGSCLLARLKARARENGIDVLRATTAAGNRAARRLDGSSTIDPRSGTLQLTLMLHDVQRHQHAHAA